jgi:hypothetical protein
LSILKVDTAVNHETPREHISWFPLSHWPAAISAHHKHPFGILCTFYLQT